MRLMTSDDYPAYGTAILHAYGQTVTPPRTGRPGRPRAPYKAAPPGLTVLGIDEDTAILRAGGVVRVLGRGTATVWRDGTATVLASGAEIPPELLTFS